MTEVTVVTVVTLVTVPTVMTIVTVVTKKLFSSKHFFQQIFFNKFFFNQKKVFNKSLKKCQNKLFSSKTFFLKLVFYKKTVFTRIFFHKKTSPHKKSSNLFTQKIAQPLHTKKSRKLLTTKSCHLSIRQNHATSSQKNMQPLNKTSQELQNTALRTSHQLSNVSNGSFQMY